MTDVYSLGPAPNSFNVSLNTAIIVDEFRPMNVSGLYLTPPVLLSETAQNYGLASVHAIFVPAKLLKPGTLYNVSAYIMGEHVAWSFTTTSASTCSFGFIEFNQEALFTSLAVAIAVMAATALIAKFMARQRNAHASS